MLRWAALPLLLTASACAANAGGSAYDGVYDGALVLLTGVSPQSCPQSFGQPVSLVVRDGAARLDLPQVTYFSGQVSRAGELTLISGGGRTAFIHGHFTGTEFTGAGSGGCQYQVHLSRQARPA